MTSNKRAEWEYANRKAPRIPRLVAYQTKGQLPLTLLALVVIATAGFVAWILSMI